MRTAVLISMVAMLIALTAPGTAQADPGDIPIVTLHLRHHVSGTIGSSSTGYMTVVSPSNGITMIVVPPNTQLPTGVQPGKHVTVTYKVNDQNQNVLEKIKLTDNIK